MDDEIVKGGWIKIFRTMLTWEWYDDINTKILFLHILLKANFEDKKWHGIEVKRGEFITSYAKLSKELKISVRSVRTALDKLKSTNEIAIKTTSKYTLINVVNYGKYQEYQTISDIVNDKQSDNQSTSDRQTNDKQTTTTKEANNIITKEFNKAAAIHEQDKNKNQVAIPEKINDMTGAVQDLRDLIIAFEKEIAPISPIVAQDMEEALEIFNKELLLEFIYDAGRNKASTWKYIDRIIQRCIREDIKTVKDFKASRSNAYYSKTSKSKKVEVSTGKYDGIFKN